MLRAINTAATGMSAQETNVNTIANNVANVNTIGFKKSRTEFNDLLYETIQEAGSQSGNNSNYNVGIQVGSGTKTAAIRKINSQGNPKITNNPFDLMINGEGYFGIMANNNQIKYTRDGAFNLDKNGILVNKNGDKVFPTITFPPETTTVNISSNGTVEAFTKNQVQPQNLGTIPIFSFVNPAGLRSEGLNLFGETNASGSPIQGIGGENNIGVIQQGALESSNVSIMNEMTNMIKAQRAYEMNAKIMGVADQMLQTVNTIR